MGNKYIRLLKKGMPLPARKRKKFFTDVDNKKGQPAPPIAIVLEGDSNRADRNKTVVEILLPPECPANSVARVLGVWFQPVFPGPAKNPV